MLRHNLFACVRDTSEGVRRPRFSTAARSGPYPLREPPGPTDDGPPRRPSFNVIGTVNTPVVVHPGRLQEVGSGASAPDGIPNPSRQSSRLDGERDVTAPFDGMSAVEGAASGKGVIQKGVNSSGRDAGISAAPLAWTELDEADDDKDVAKPSSARSLSALGLSGGSEAAIQAGASGRGLMTGDGLAGNGRSRRSSALPPHRNDLGPTKLAPAQDGAQGATFLCNSDVASTESGSKTRGFSGRKIIRHGESNEYEHDNLTPSEGKEIGADDVSGAVRGAGRGRSGGKFTFDRPNGRPPVESDVPERRVVGAAGAADSFSSVALRDSASHFGDGHPNGEGVESNSGKQSRGLPRLPWGARGPTEVDIPRRRSVDTSGHMGVATESEDSDSQLSHLLDSSKGERRPGAAFSRLPVGFRNNPTESSLPRRRFSRDLPGEGSRGSPDASMRNGEYEDSSSPDVGDFATEKGGEFAELDVSASHGSRKRGRVRGWGVTSRAPAAVDLPRRRSGYSVDSSVHSTENASVAAGSLQQVVANDSRAEGDDSVGDKRGAPSGFGIRGTSVLAGLTGINRRPVESDLPRRRRSSEFSLPEGGGMPSTEDVSSRGDGTSGTSADKDEAVSESSASSSRGLSRRGSARGGWRSGLKSRAPVVVDLPRRSSGYSVDGSGQSLRLQQREDAEDRDTEDMKSDVDAGVCTTGQGSGEVPSVSADRKSLFPALAGHKRAPIESDLPRRRPSMYLPVGGAGTAGDAVENSEAGADASESRGDENEAVCDSSVSSSRELSGRGSARGGWRDALKSRAPVVVDLPRRSSGYSTDVSGRSVDGYDVTGGQSLRLQQGGNAEEGGTEDMKSDADARVGPPRQGSGGVPDVSADRQSLFPALAGRKRAPVESDVPRRRPSMYLAAGEAGTVVDVVEKSKADVDVSESQGVGMGRSGKGGRR